MAGNGAVLKHASNVPRCALQIEEVLRDAGFPRELFRTALVTSAGVAPLIAHPRVAAVTLTGSDLAGRQVGEQAGRELKKTVLELGGSDPFIVLEDADLDAAARVAADARLVNGGQSCIAAKRFIAVEPIAERFLELFAGELRKRRMGDPLSRDTDVGPQARHDLRDELHQQVEESLRRGAKLLLGGEIPAGPGAFYPPTLLAAVERGMPAFDEETFGPVAAVIRAKDEADAIRLANDSQFGLGASLWTAQPRAGRAAGRAHRGGLGVRQRAREVGPAAAVRRDQALGLWPRALRVRHPGVREHQDGLDRLIRRRPGPAPVIRWRWLVETGGAVSPDPARLPPIGFPPPWPARPWIYGNVIASANGVVTWRRAGPDDDPVRAIAGGDFTRPGRRADLELMRQLRASADAVSFGAQTLRDQPDLVGAADDVGGELGAALRRFREAQGRPRWPLHVLYSASGALDLGRADVQHARPDLRSS